MMDNKIKISGTILENPHFLHTVHGKKIYWFYIVSKRLSDNVDVLPCLVEEPLLNEIHDGEKIVLYGEILSTTENGRLSLYVLVRSVSEHTGIDENFVELDGIICKNPVLRVTPFKRIICDLLIANNRSFNRKGNYIPCIAWYENAKKTACFPVGEMLRIEGRLQSREYMNSKNEIRTVFEVAVRSVDVIKKEDGK